MLSKEMEKRSSRLIEMGLRKRIDSLIRSRGGICRDRGEMKSKYMMVNWGK